MGVNTKPKAGLEIIELDLSDDDDFQQPPCPKRRKLRKGSERLKLQAEEDNAAAVQTQTISKATTEIANLMELEQTVHQNTSEKEEAQINVKNDKEEKSEQSEDDDEEEESEKPGTNRK